MGASLRLGGGEWPRLCAQSSRECTGTSLGTERVVSTHTHGRVPEGLGIMEYPSAAAAAADIAASFVPIHRTH